MHRVATEVVQEVGVLLEHRHLDALAGEQEPEHHPGGPTAGDRDRRPAVVHEASVLRQAAAVSPGDADRRGSCRTTARPAPPSSGRIAVASSTPEATVPYGLHCRRLAAAPPA